MSSMPLFRVEDREHFTFEDTDEEISGSEIIYLRTWDEADGLPPRDELEGRYRRLFGPAVTEEDDCIEADLRVCGSGVDVATVVVFLSSDGLELSGQTIGDDLAIISDIEALLSIQRSG